MKTLKPVDFKAVAAKGAFVYCYLRADGSPYYIGISINAARPFRLKKPKTPNIIRPIPGRPELVRVLRSGLTWQQAQDWERFYIAHYGRKDLGTGILRNRTAGGDGCTDHGPAALEAMREALRKGKQIVIANAHKKSAKRYGVSVGYWKSLTEKQRRYVLRRWTNGVRGADLFRFDVVLHNTTSKLQASADKYGCTLKHWQSLSEAERDAVRVRYLRGVRGERLLMPSSFDGYDDMNVKTVRKALSLNVCPREFESLGAKGRAAFAAYCRRNGLATIHEWASCKKGPNPAAA